MNWTKSMQEGWYYYTTNDLDHPDGIKWMDVSITQADLDEMEITLLGPVPSPGTTFTIQEFLTWIHDVVSNSTFRFIDPIINDPQSGIAAVTARHGKEEG